MSNSNTLRRIILLPLSAIYGSVTAMRNKLFDWGLLKQRQFNIPIISVGNLAVGGTGKTPHTEHIVRTLKSRYKVGILSRGYKRHTKGFVLATPHSTPRDIGDESYQMYHKFGRKVMVAVCERRVVGIEKMLEIEPELDVIVLDDGFQHRYVQPKVNILLTEYNKPFFADSMLPYGRLRESVKGVSRADMVIVTKCPQNIKAIDYRILKKNLDLIPDQNLFFSRYAYDDARAVFPQNAVAGLTMKLENLPQLDSLLAVCGIGNPRPFVRYVKSFAPRVNVNIFPDHHDFNRKDMEILVNRFNAMQSSQKFIITTEKDAVRLVNNPYFPHALKPYIYFIPIRVSLDDTNNSDFESTLIRLINGRR